MSNTPNHPKNSPTSRPGYEHLVVFMLGKVIQDLTVKFCDHWIEKESRTFDQMVQAARSNPQNMAEGYMAESLKSYIFLVDPAHGSDIWIEVIDPNCCSYGYLSTCYDTCYQTCYTYY